MNRTARRSIAFAASVLAGCLALSGAWSPAFGSLPDPSLHASTQMQLQMAPLPGHLVEFDGGPGTNGWHAYDHTPEVGGTTIAGDPATLQSGGLVRVFART